MKKPIYTAQRHFCPAPHRNSAADADFQISHHPKEIGRTVWLVTAAVQLQMGNPAIVTEHSRFLVPSLRNVRFKQNKTFQKVPIIQNIQIAS